MKKKSRYVLYDIFPIYETDSAPQRGRKAHPVIVVEIKNGDFYVVSVSHT